MTEEEIAWKMPKPDVGQAVKVFPYGRDDGKPHYAFVSRVSDRSIDVKDPFNIPRGGVRFIDDPCLKSTTDENRKDWGAWDFTDETKAMRSALEGVAALEKRVKALEELLEKKTK